MALSKIWSAFIIVAIMAACLNMLFSVGNQDIFNRMVVGKAGDTTHTTIYDSAHVPSKVAAVLGSAKEIKDGNLHYIKSSGSTVTTFFEQNADGILATCKSAVEICIGLIGVMALFMGFMSIAEKAGGIRFLSKIIGPFFSKLFPDVPKQHPAFGIKG